MAGALLVGGLLVHVIATAGTKVGQRRLTRMNAPS